MLNGESIECHCRFLYMGDIEPIRDTGRYQRGGLFMNLEGRLERSRELYWVLYTDSRMRNVEACKIGYDYRILFRLDSRRWFGHEPVPRYKNRLFGWEIEALGTRGSFFYCTNGGGAAVRGGEPKEVKDEPGLVLELGRNDPDWQTRWNTEGLSRDRGHLTGR